MLLAALLLGPIQDVPAPARSHSHVHAADEIDEVQKPLMLELTYTSDLIGVAAGGKRRGARYLDNLDIVAEADLGELAGWSGAELHVYGLYNNGASISDLAGDAQAVSNIETGTRALRLYEAWLDQRIGKNASIRFGLYDLNSEFDTLEASGLFPGSAHGIGTDFAQSGRNGPSIFPSTALGARVELGLGEGLKARVAVLDGVPGNPDRPARTVIRLGKQDGALIAGELDMSIAGARILLGHWRYTARFEAPDGSTGRGNAGVYVRAEATVATLGGSKLDAFGRIGTASGRFNMFDRFASTGLKLTSTYGEAGLAVATGFISDMHRIATGAGPSETILEATYRRSVAPWLALQPSLQYVFRPAGDRSIRNALVLGLRSEFSFRFEK